MSPIYTWVAMTSLTVGLIRAASRRPACGTVSENGACRSYGNMATTVTPREHEPPCPFTGHLRFVVSVSLRDGPSRGMPVKHVMLNDEQNVKRDADKTQPKFGEVAKQR